MVTQSDNKNACKSAASFKRMICQLLRVLVSTFITSHVLNPALSIYLTVCMIIAKQFVRFVS